MFTFGHALRFPDQAHVPCQGRSVVRNRNVVPKIERRNVDTLLGAKRGDETFRSEGRGSTVRVVHHNDVLDSKQMLCDCYGTQRIHGAPAGDHHHRENRGGGSDLPAAPVPKNLARVDFSRDRLRHRLGNVHGARIVTIDYDRSQRNGLLERLSHFGLNESRLLRKHVAIELHLITPLSWFHRSAANLRRSPDSVHSCGYGFCGAMASMRGLANYPTRARPPS